ncbi:hypothetical protein BD780_001754 [Clostridium tetanomorphum]|uniref:Uncharacterized protein n=1 Tax=Clostridium tetanomorphum TaxID=1553 RepID=A0A923J0Z2_CLOTT|nr:hypothetical protein [Clostridium tetanomorphum]KAJ51880.1 hypothetical protein CTM_10346 [Clostridium tetanomorphum DSM 665]MBC2398607.1 hypothetical protein [Clostridium tetanomorphum]MBP1864116.1 hypothetical protein [Clostridium tetanomorphum]NRS84529.1 hypothetical protein [Clostridium tetanomorphum]NRZ97743.1 hypothetical protein [Clostridium tetanomorphum]
MTGDKIIFILAAVVALSIIICIVKKVAKLVIFVLVLFLAFTLVKGFMTGKSPEDMVNATKVDAIYTKQLYNYTEKVKNAVQSSLNALDEKSLPKLKEENEKLHTYLNEVIKLPHGEELNTIHNKYCDYLKGIVSSSDNTIAAGNFTESTTKQIEQAKEKLNNYLDYLVNVAK